MEELISTNGHTAQSNLQIKCHPNQITPDIFQELEQSKILFIYNHKRPRIDKVILKNKKQGGGITLPDVRQYYKATVIKTVWSWYQNRHKHQWKGTASPELNPDTYSTLICNKGIKNIKWGKKHSLFSKWCWKNWTATCKSMNLEDTLTPYTKIKSKWLKDLNVSQDTTPRRVHCWNILWHQPHKYFLRSVSQGNRNKSQNKPVGPNQTEKLFAQQRKPSEKKKKHKKTT